MCTSRLLFIAVSILGVLSGCAPQKEEATDLSSETLAVLPTYEDLNSKVFQVHCIGCHASASDNGIDFSTYPSLINSMNAQGGLAVFQGDYENSRIWIRTRPSGGMPPNNSQLPKGANLAIQNWIHQGAQQN